MSTDEFSVCQFFAEDFYDYECRYVDVAKAISTFRFLTTNVAAQTGFTKRVIVTDGGDHVCMEWKFGEGLTFPPELIEKWNGGGHGPSNSH